MGWSNRKKIRVFYSSDFSVALHFFCYPARSDGIAGAQSKDHREAIIWYRLKKSLRGDSSLRRLCSE